jgi:hypothetical protein
LPQFSLVTGHVPISANKASSLSDSLLVDLTEGDNSTVSPIPPPESALQFETERDQKLALLIADSRDPNASCSLIINGKTGRWTSRIMSTA